MTHPTKQKIRILWQSALLLALLLAAGSPLRAGPTLDTSSPISFFTNTANLFLKTSGYPFTVGNIPIYPTNYYTPALHRLLQLAANMYDASTNRAFDDGSSPNGPFYPSVFRPTFNTDGTNVFITGYVEDIPNPGSRPTWATPPLSLPDDLAQVSASTVNIYGIPWVIGARKNLPNFNEFTMQSISQITRRVEIVRSSPIWQTNVQYIIGVSNSLGVEAWNSYTNAPRPTVLYGFVNLGVVLSNETSLIYPPAGVAPTNLFAWNYGAPLGANPWGPYNPAQIATLNALSFQIPLRTNTIFLPDMVYHPAQFPQLSTSTNFDSLPLMTNVLLPHFVLNLTNHIQFVLVDYNSERVVDYVSFGFNTNRDLTAELQGSDHGGDGGVWNSTLIAPNGGNNYGTRGILNQILISEGITPFSQSPFSTADWTSDTLVPSQRYATTSFATFMADTAKHDGASAQAPYTPTRKVSVTYSWQANDPLVHYTMGDLSMSQMPKSIGFTNGVPAYWKLNTNNAVLPNIQQVNYRYYPWRDKGLPTGWAIGDVYNSPAFKDPLITQSSDWNFPSGQPLSLQTIGGIHRGTPWQTVYLKSSPVTLSNWQAWTGDTLIIWNGNKLQFDAALSQPTNDWALVSALAPLLNPVNPTQLVSINTSDTNTWESLFECMTVLTNTQSGLTPLVIDTNSNAAALNQIIAAINATRSIWPGHLYTSLGQILSIPQLSVSSPFLDTQDISTNYLSDAAYESLPSQLLPLLRIDSVGSVVNSGATPALQFSGVDGYPYNVQASTNLHDWTTIATQQYTTNGTFLFTDPAATNFPQRYYRTVLTP